MTTITKFASSNAVITTGWTSPTNAYADDTSYATAIPAKNATINSDYGFANFTTGDIPDGSTINSVTMSCRVFNSAATANKAHGIQGRNNAVNSGTEAVQASALTSEVTLTTTLSGVTLTDLRSASTLLKARVRSTQGNSSTTSTSSLDWVTIGVDWTAPVLGGSFTLDALVNVTDLNTFTLDARVRATQVGSFTVNAEKFDPSAPTIEWGLWSDTWQNTISAGNTVASSFTANAVIRKPGQGGSFTVNALVKRTFPDDFTADATIRRNQVGSFTANAVTKDTETGSFTLNAVVRRPGQPGSLTLDAVIRRPGQSGSFTLNAVLIRSMTGAFAISALLKRSQTGSFTANAILKVTDLNTTTLDAVIRRPGQAGAFIVDAVVRKPGQAGSFTLAAVLRRTGTGSFTADAAIKRSGAGSFPLDAVIKRTASAATTVDAVIKATKPGSFTASALIKRTASGSFLLDAVLKKTQASSLTVDAVVRRSAAGSFALDAVVRRSAAGTFTLDAIQRRAGAGSFTLNAWLNRKVSSSFTASAVIRATQTTGFSIDAQILGLFGRSGSFGIDAVIRRPGMPGSFTVNAVLLRHIAPSTFTANAWLNKKVSSSFAVDAVIRRNMAGSFLVDAWLNKKVSSGFTVDAIVKSTRSGSTTLDAAIRRTASGSFTVDALLLRRGLSGSFAVNAVLRRPATGSLTLDAIIKGARSGSLTLDAIRLRTFVFGAAGSPGPAIRQEAKGTGSATLGLSPVTGNLVVAAWEQPDNNVASVPAGFTQIDTGPDGYYRAHSSFGGLGRLGYRWTQAGDSATVSTNGNASIVIAEVANLTTGSSPAAQAFARSQNSTVISLTSGTPGSYSFIVGGLATRLNGGTVTPDVGVFRLPSDGALPPTNVGHDRAAILWRSSGTAAALSANQAGTTQDGYWWGMQIAAFAAPAPAPAVDGPGPTLDAVIKRSASGSFTANALVRRTGTGSLTVDAAIRKGGAGSFTLNAVIRRAGAGSFTVSAIARRPAAGTFSVNAWIRAATVVGTFTVNAIATRTASRTFFVNASIATRITGTFLAEAEITLYKGFSVNALISVTAFHDTFTRTVPVGFGSHYGRPYRSITASSVNGNEGQIAALARQVAWNEYPRIQRGWIRLDLQLPTSTADSNFYFEVDAASVRESAGTPVLLEGWIDSGLFHVDIYALGERASADVSFVPGAWYSVAAWVDYTPGGWVGFKVWKRGDPEPTTWTASGYRVGPTTWTESYFWFDSVETGTLLVDNYRLDVIDWADYIPYDSFTLDAEISKRGGRFKLDAWLSKTFFALDAIIRVDGGQQGVFLLEARISRQFFTLNAQIRRAGSFTLAAVIRRPGAARSFTLNAWKFAGTWQKGFSLDALIKGRPTGRWYTNAEIRLPHVARAGDFDLDANLLAHAADSFTLEARVFDGKWAKSFVVDADIKGLHEKRGTFTLAAVVRLPVEAVFLLEAEVGGRGYFRVSAYIRPYFWIDAEIVAAAPRMTGSFKVDARITNGREFTLNALVNGHRGGAFGIGALVWKPGLQDGRYFWLDAETQRHQSGSFTLAARIANGFTINAFIRPYFTLNAYIRGNNYILWPADGGPAEDPDGVELPPWYKASRKYRIKITVGGVDVTGDTRWSATTFTQNAKTNPGTFELVLYGSWPFDGGEIVLVELDDFRTFGGYVLQVERGYVFTSKADVIVTTLRGADFNILFDKLITYNRSSADDPSGAYSPYKAFAKGSLDTRIIRKVFDSYIDKPAGLEYKTYVETAGVAAPEKPWAMPTSGAPLRQVMQSLSQVTNAIWWIDPYMHLHYGPRTVVTAPYPITDGLGGISSANLSMTEDMSMLVTDGFLWGVLAYDIDGEIVMSRRKSTMYPDVGPFQYGEFRSDLHHERFIDRRIASVIERYGLPIKKAKAVIFEPGYQAGQVADVRLTEHGLTGILVIQSMTLSFAVMKEPRDGWWYGVPRFELSIGLDPESPWDIYDYLPFKGGDNNDPLGWGHDETGKKKCIDENPPTPGDPGGCSAEICGITDSFSRTTSTWDGGYNEKHGGWGVSDQGTEWGGAVLASFANGSAGVFRLEGHDSDPAAPPGWSEFDNVWSQQQYLNWQGTEPPMDVLVELQFSRALLPDDSGHFGNPDYWGEYLWIFFGDGAPHTSGKFEVTISGNVGMQLYLWSDDGETAWRPIPVDVTQPFYVRTTHPGPDTPISLWIWQKGDTQPTDPYLTLMGASSSNGGITLEAASNNVQQPLIEYRVLSLDVEGVDRCGDVQFDNFNRTVSDGFGMATNGTPWRSFSGAAAASVDGTSALFTSTVTGQERHIVWNDDELASAPWWDWSTPTDPFRPCRMKMGFWFDFVPPGAGEGYVRLTAQPGSAVDLMVNITSAFGNWSMGGTGENTPITWVRGRKYVAEWEFIKDSPTSGTSRFVVYEEGSAPGVWQEATFTEPGNSMLDLYYYNASPSGTAKPVHIDYIEFDYDGKPCYQDCPPPPFDNFSRTVSNGWGSSGTGLVWTEEPDAHSGVDGSHSHFTVDGYYGFHNVDAGWTSTAISAPLGIGKTFKMRTLWRPARTGARLYFSPAPWGYYDGGAFEIQFTQPGATGTNAFVGMTNAAGFMTIPSWALGANWLNLELTLADGQATLRVQKAGFAPIYSLGPASVTSYSFSYINFSDGPFAVDYIDFEGGECNPLQTCEELAVDTFDRTVPLGTTWGGDWRLPEVDWVNPPNMSVNGGIATMNDGNADPYDANDPMLSLPDESSLPLEMLAQFRINTPTAGYDPDIENLDWSLYFYTRDVDGFLFRWGSVEIYMDDPGGGLWVTAIHSGPGSTLSTTEFQLPVGAWENRWLNIRLRVEPTQSMARVWAAGDDEPSSWPSVHSRSAALDTSYGLVPSVQVLGFGDGFSVDFESISIVHCDVRNASTPGTPGGGDPTGPGGPCEDVEGEQFGAVTQGWGCERLPVTDGIIELTGQAARSTLTLYDATTGEHIADGWFEDQAGKTFRVPDGITEITACYRNYTPELGNNPSVPRLTEGTVGRNHPM